MFFFDCIAIWQLSKELQFEENPSAVNESVLIFEMESHCFCFFHDVISLKGFQVKILRILDPMGYEELIVTQKGFHSNVYSIFWGLKGGWGCVVHCFLFLVFCFYSRKLSLSTDIDGLGFNFFFTVTNLVFVFVFVGVLGLGFGFCFVFCLTVCVFVSILRLFGWFIVSTVVCFLFWPVLFLLLFSISKV